MMVRSRSSRRIDPIQRSAKVLATGVRMGVRRIFKPSALTTSSKASMNWLPRSRTKARALSSWSACRRNRLRATWVLQTPVGFAVALAKNTWRVSMWMKNST